MTASVGRAVLLPLAGLIVWAAHFGAIYAAHALSCERDLTLPTALGVPLATGFVALATLLAFVLLAALALRARPAGTLAAGETQPAFTDWFGFAAAALAALAVLFQAVPAFVLPACG